MVSYDELHTEEAFNAERIPEGLANLREEILRFYQWEGWRIGIVGDNNHLWGYHRSRRWINESRFCTNRLASVSETPGNIGRGDSNHVAAIDLVTNEVAARAIYTRVNHARIVGRLPQLRQVILETSPWHVHLSFDRGSLNDNHTLLFNIITNRDFGGGRMVTVNATMPELSEGSEGGHVSTWQTLANLRGASLKVDGEFGPLTRQATMDAQRKYGAESIDGVVGPETWVIGLAAEDQV